MAIFQDENLVDVTTPDGRTLKLPASVAQSFGFSPQQSAPPPDAQPAQHGVGPGPFQMPEFNPALQAPAGPQPKPANAGALMQPEQDVAPSPRLVGPTAAGPTQPGQPAPRPAQPSKQRLNDADLSKQGYAGAINAGEDALAARAEAGRHAADFEAAGQIAQASVYDEQSKRMDALFQKQAADEAAAEKDYQTRNTALESARQKYANTKIDRKADHSTIAWIGIALAGLGQAMEGKGGQPNPALQAYYTALDRKVAGQEADLDKQGKAIGYQKEALDGILKHVTDQRARHDALMSAEAARAAILVKKIGAQSGSDLVKARAEEFAADLQMKGAEWRTSAVEKQKTHEEKVAEIKQSDVNNRRQVSAQYAGIAAENTRAANELKYKYKHDDVELAKAIAAAHGAGNDAKAKHMDELVKDNEQRGIRNVATAEPLLNAQGQKLFEAAKSADAQADAMEQKLGTIKPEMQAAAKMQIDALRTKAEDARNTAKIEHQVRGRDAVQAGKAGTTYASAQSITSLNQDIQDLYDKTGKGWGKTDENRAAIRSKVTEWVMKQKNVWGLGVLSKQDTTLLRSAGIEDPTNVDADYITDKITNGLLGKDENVFRASLNSLAEGAKKDAINELRANTTWDGKDADKLFFSRPKPDEATSAAAQKVFQEKTPAEREADRGGRGIAGRAVESTIEPYSRAINPEQLARAAKSGRSLDDVEQGDRAEDVSGLTSGHLSAGQEEATNKLIAAYKSGNKRAGDLLITQAQSDRAGLGLGTMHTLRDAAPDLYQAARPGVQGELADQLSYEENRGAPPKAEPAQGHAAIETLAKRAITGDAAAFESLQGLAANDPAARAWVKGIQDLRARQGAR